MLKEAEKAVAEVINEKVIIQAESEVAEQGIENVLVEETQDTEKVFNSEELDTAEIVNDEFCSNTSYSEDKTSPTPSRSAPPPPSSRRLGSFDYYSLKFEDFYEDPD